MVCASEGTTQRPKSHLTQNNDHSQLCSSPAKDAPSDG
ncbi:hypothetical protein SynPROSU1_00946 [Synechococcus sp. PROS-U-1]|nr:hypothetical protein SynPROSU1_00946 [Synechococcus sp. PROS-U-1]